MKIKITKRLAALTLAGAMLSLTGCGAEKNNNEIAIERECSYNNDIFSDIGIDNYIIESEEFKNIIKDLEDKDLYLYGTIVDNKKTIQLINKENELCGVLAYNTKNVVNISYKTKDTEKYDYNIKNYTYEFDNQGKYIGNMLTDNYFDEQDGTVYTVTTTNDKLYLQAVTLKNAKNQELGISIGKPDEKTNLLIVNDLELEIESDDYEKIEKLMYQSGKENDFINFPSDILEILDKYKIDEVDNIAEINIMRV